MSTGAIRTARHDDAGPVAALYIDAWRTAYAGLVPDRVLVGMSQSAQQFNWARQIDGADCVLVAVDGRDRPVGVASGGGCRDRQFRDAGEVFTLYVSPARQGQGHGRALLDAMLSAHTKSGHTSALLWVLAGNPSRFFYEAMGGVRVAERIEAIWGAKLPEFAYRWTLAPQSRDAAPGNFLPPANNDEGA